jgi:MFS family permease
MIFSPVGGWVADKTARKRRLAAGGLLLQGLLGLAGMQLVHTIPAVVLYLFLEGMVSPITNGPVLPDMLQSTQVQGEPTDPRTTNLVTSLFTTAFNFGGFVGPLAGSELQRRLGFRGMLSCYAVGLIAWGLVLGVYQEVAHRRQSRQLNDSADYRKLREEEEEEEEEDDFKNELDELRFALYVLPRAANSRARCISMLS